MNKNKSILKTLALCLIVIFCVVEVGYGKMSYPLSLRDSNLATQVSEKLPDELVRALLALAFSKNTKGESRKAIQGYLDNGHYAPSAILAIDTDAIWEFKQIKRPTTKLDHALNIIFLELLKVSLVIAIPSLISQVFQLMIPSAQLVSFFGILLLANLSRLPALYAIAVIDEVFFRGMVYELLKSFSLFSKHHPVANIIHASFFTALHIILYAFLPFSLSLSQIYFAGIFTFLEVYIFALAYDIGGLRYSIILHLFTPVLLSLITIFGISGGLGYTLLAIIIVYFFGNRINAAQQNKKPSSKSKNLFDDWKALSNLIFHGQIDYREFPIDTKLIIEFQGRGRQKRSPGNITLIYQSA